jgi:hypothetical protein
MSNIHFSSFAGLHSVLDLLTPDARPAPNNIIDDLNGEQETIPDLTPDDVAPSETLLSQWKTSVNGASKGITEKTDTEYRRFDRLLSKITLKKTILNRDLNYN